MGEVESVRCKFTAILAQKQNEVKRLCFLGAHSLLTRWLPACAGMTVSGA